MGSTFTGQTLTQTGKIGKDTIDPSKISFGNLALTQAAMTSEVAFKSPYDTVVGSDVKLIHGNCWNEITGQVTENVGMGVTTEIGKLAAPPLTLPGSPPATGGGGWLKVTVDGDMTLDVTGNLTQTVVGIETLTVTGGWQEDQQGPVNRHYGQKVTDTFDDDHDVHVPDSAAFQISLFSNTLVGGTQIGICTGFFMALTTALSLSLANFDLEGKTLHAEHHPIHAAGTFVDLTADFTDAQVDALKALIAPTAKVEPAANAAPSIGTGTPLR